MHILKITSLYKETPNTTSIVFKIPEELRETYRFVAGQYVFVQKEIDNKLYKRAYSITSKPNTGVLQVTVKETASGDFSKYINNELKVGDTVEVSAPKGNFVLPVDKDNAKNYLGFATGSGIAPIYAMIMAVLENEPNSKFGLFYGNKNQKDTIFKEKLDKLQNEYPNQFFVQYLYSQEVVPGAITGRINKKLVDFVIKNKFKDITWEQFYICGQEDMKEQVSNSLLINGVPEEAIYFELFSKPKKSNLVKMNIILDGEEKELRVAKTTTILDAAIAAGLDPSYSCQGGFCTSCMATVTEGQAEMEENSTLNDDEIAAGKVLTCVARATTDTLSVNFDI
jgi:ring-1,2-phenylacetyl-CoA epoxidase subunit PaaE